jgi:hypothetical protein
MHQQSLDLSYCKRETSPTKLKNSKSVMILVVRITSSPIRGYMYAENIMYTLVLWTNLG